MGGAGAAGGVQCTAPLAARAAVPPDRPAAGPAPPPADDSSAIQAAINAAAAEAARTGKGVAATMPDGTYQIRKAITISSPRVVLRGSSVRERRAGSVKGVC
mgnify:CR=1 FL=1